MLYNKAIWAQILLSQLVLSRPTMISCQQFNLSIDLFCGAYFVFLILGKEGNGVKETKICNREYHVVRFKMEKDNVSMLAQ